MKKILILFIIPLILITSCNTNTINKNTSSSSDFEENNTTFSCSKRTIETQNRKIADMFDLVNETGRIDRVDYRLVFRTLDYILVGVDGGLEVVFLSGTRV